MLATKRLPPPLKWHGGKWYLAPKIIALMPRHIHYVEPFAGGLSVLLAKKPDGISEVVNDIHGQLSNFWRVLQHDHLFAQMQRFLEAVPFSESEWKDSDLVGSNPAESAARFFIRCRQSLAGRFDCFAPISRRRTRRGMNEQASAWLSAIEGLPAVHGRLKRVAVLNRDAFDVIRQQDSEGTLFYLDPPYLSETRTVDDVYTHEMTVSQHADLLDTVKNCRGKVMLSGYRSPMYDDQLAAWNRHEFSLPNQAASGKTKRRMIEVVWCNF